MEAVLNRGFVMYLVSFPGSLCPALFPGSIVDTLECPVYRGTPLLWTPWGPSEVSSIQWNPSIVDTLETSAVALMEAVLNRGFVMYLVSFPGSPLWSKSCRFFSWVVVLEFGNVTRQSCVEMRPGSAVWE